MPTAQSLLGRTFGNWVLRSVLGEGGFGAVFEAVHSVYPDKRAAIKILHAELALDDNMKRRFLNEANAATRADHENIITIYDGGITPDGICYCVMELLPGRPLSKHIEEAPLSLERTARVGAQVARALAAAHRVGIVHRDLKPDNIFVTSREDRPDFVKVLDFGIAKLHGDLGASGPRTKTGMILGTPAYMAPEQWLAEPDIDARADIYSFGIILYECATGAPPFHGTNLPSWINAHLAQAPAPLPFTDEAGRRFDAVVQRMLAKNRADRPESMSEIATELQSLFSASTAPAPMPRVTPPPRQVSTLRNAVGEVAPAAPEKRGSGALKIAIAVAAIALAGGGTALVLHAQQDKKHDPGPAPVPYVGELARADELLARENWDDALVLLRNLAAAHPDDAALAEKVRHTDGERASREAYYRFVEGDKTADLRKALAAYAEIADDSIYRKRAAERYAAIRNELLSTQLDAARKAVDAHRCDEARQHVEAVLAVDESNAEAQDLIKSCTAAPTKRHHESVRFSDEVVAPTAHDTLIQQAQDAYVHGQYANAIEIARRAGPNDQKALRIIGAASCFLHDRQSAVDVYQKLDTSARQFLKYVCSRNAITVP